MERLGEGLCAFRFQVVARNTEGQSICESQSTLDC